MADEELTPGAAPPPPRAPMPRWVKWFAGISAVVIAIGIAGTVIRLPYYTYSPGGALDLAPRVKITGTKTYSDRGPVMLLFVRERARVNVWSWVQAKLDSDIDLVKQQQATGGVSEKHLDEQAVCDMTQSKIAARAAALHTLGYKATQLPGVDITSFPRGQKGTQTITFPAEDALLPCDEIVAAEGHTIKQPTDLSKIIQTRPVGSKVALRIVRNGHARNVDVPVAEYEGKHLIGVSAAARFSFPVDISVDTSDISGPSAGLAMTLAIIDDLTPGDLTGGKRVAVTGTIAADGTVGEIGAITQKAVAAKAAHAQIFIVPACAHDAYYAGCVKDLKSAKDRVGKHVDVEPVATLAEALRVLQKAGGAAVPTSTSTTTPN